MMMSMASADNVGKAAARSAHHLIFWSLATKSQQYSMLWTHSVTSVNVIKSEAEWLPDGTVSKDCDKKRNLDKAVLLVPC